MTCSLIVQWGRPTFSLTSVLTMLPALFVNVVESVANYYTCARFSSEYMKILLLNIDKYDNF